MKETIGPILTTNKPTNQLTNYVTTIIDKNLKHIKSPNLDFL